MAPYHYHSFQSQHQIRLIKFCSETADQPKVSLLTCSLDDDNEYYALSYCWGKWNAALTLDCDGSELQISPGLRDALIHLQLFREDANTIQYFWVDQICINQQDPDERTQQVKLMRRIYEQARRTLIWLGPYNPQLDGNVFDLIARVDAARHNKNYDVPQSMHHGRALGQITISENSRLGLPDFDSPAWNELVQLLKRPWFDRVWIIQEAALSRLSPLILCGDENFPWDEFSNAIDWLDRQGYDTATDFNSYAMTPFFIHDTRRFRDQQSGKPQLWRLEAILAMIRSVQATDSRDQIYAILGLTSDFKDDGANAVLSPDYRKCKFDVFADVARYCIKKSNRLAILGAGGSCLEEDTSSKSSTGRPPTWVPRWDLTSQTEAGKTIPHGYAPFVDASSLVDTKDVMGYNAGGGTAVQLQETDSLHELRLKGLAVDRISWCSSILKRKDFLDYKTSPIRPLWESALENSNLKVDHSDLQFLDFARAFYVTIVAGFDPERNPAKHEPMNHFFCYLTNCYESLETSGEDFVSKLQIYRQLGMGGDDNRIVPYLPGRKFFITEKGYMGYGAAGLKTNDEVFVMFGGNVPYVLRKAVTGFHLIGEAFLYGFMEAEALDQRNEDLLAEEWVSLW